MNRRSPARCCARLPALLLGCALALAGLPAVPAAASISDVAPIDGPSADIVDLGGVAMAADGTGGLVYRRRVEGRTHIFASRFDGAGWTRPQRVDVDQRFDSSWPAIAAGNDGRLVVTWVQEFGAGTDRMFGAAVGRGATRFQRPIPVDLNVGEATATHPSLAMNAGGTAYLTYRVVFAASGAGSSLPDDTADADIRVARTTGSLWSVIGQPLDRNPQIPVRTPNAGNSPRIAVDQSGNAVLAFQEPDDDGFDRIYARRLFGTNVGVPLQVSPSKAGERRIQAPADQFALDVAGFGQAAVAYRQQPDEAAGLPKARIFTNTIPESFSEAAAKFRGERVADGFPAPGPPRGLGPASVAVTPQGRLLTGFAVENASVSVPADDQGVAGPERLDDGSSSVPGDPVLDVSSSGAAAYAFKAQVGRQGAVAVRELRADGVGTTTPLSAPRGGAVSDVRLSGSGLGDAAVAWLQGTGAGTQIAAAVVDAPPQQFAAQAPIGFVRDPRIEVTWDPAPSAIRGVTYSVSVDDEEAVTDLNGLRTELDAKAVGDGLHTVVVTATDAGGQETESIPTELSVDRRPPALTLRAKGRTIALSISDGPKTVTSGASAAGTTVSFGDGRRMRGRVSRIRHRYRRAGRYRVTVSTRDRVGNRRTITRTVRVK